MFESLGTALDEAPAERERTPVRRQSRAAGRCEGVFWRRTDRKQVSQIVLAARRYELANKKPGNRNGPLGGVAIELVELFANMVNFRTGQLDPSIETLMRHLRRSRDAIVRALKALRDHGFLDWLRRYVPTGNEGRGPQVQQTSNAYRLSLPQRALQFLGRWGEAPPHPMITRRPRQSAWPKWRHTGRASRWMNWPCSRWAIIRLGRLWPTLLVQ